MNRRFLVANAVGGAAWGATMATAGYLAGNSWHTVAHYVTGAGLALMGGVVVLFVIRGLVRRARRRHPGGAGLRTAH